MGKKVAIAKYQGDTFITIFPSCLDASRDPDTNSVSADVMEADTKDNNFITYNKIHKYRRAIDEDYLKAQLGDGFRRCSKHDQYKMNRLGNFINIIDNKQLTWTVQGTTEYIRIPDPVNSGKQIRINKKKELAILFP